MKQHLFKAAAIALGLLAIFSQDLSARSLKGKKFDFTCSDPYFRGVFVDEDRTITDPIECRYIHGGFEDGTLFAMYFPKKEDFKGRFFQYNSPAPESELTTRAWPHDWNPICFSVDHGAYFIQTNEGGTPKFSDGVQQGDPTIGAYRANAAAAEFSRHIAALIYDCERPYGYCFGGSGGAYRTTGAIENTEGVWDGAVPFVLGSPMAIPNVFGARMHALRILGDKLDGIADAVEVGGSGNPYEGLSAEEAQTLLEVSRLGFPIRAWKDWRYMDAHGFRSLYKAVVSIDRSYFEHDFWNTPGYLGYDNPKSLEKDHIMQGGRVARIIGEKEAEARGLLSVLSDAEKGTADQSWRSAAQIPSPDENVMAFELDREIGDIGLGGDLVILKKEGSTTFQLQKTRGNIVVLSGMDPQETVKAVSVGDSVFVDNSDWLAAQTHYRHQVPSPDFYVWDQFKGYGGNPLYPQRPILIGPIITRSAAGCVPSGQIKAKVILCCSLWDREAFPWQGDWYRSRVEESLGKGADDNFRLWYTDRATHGEVVDPTNGVSYNSTLLQALLDLDDWVRYDIAPSKNSVYSIEDGQVLLDDDGSTRGGIQPSVKATVNGREKAETRIGERVTVKVVADVPQGAGSIFKAVWKTDGIVAQDQDVPLSDMTISRDGAHVEFERTFSYNESGTFFPSVEVFSSRNGDGDVYTLIPNIAKTRIIVK